MPFLPKLADEVDTSWSSRTRAGSWESNPNYLLSHKLQINMLLAGNAADYHWNKLLGGH